MNENSLAFWMTLAGTICWGVCFWWMYRLSNKQNILLAQLREQGKRIEKLSKIEHDLIKEVHPQVNEIKEGMDEMIAVVKENSENEAAARASETEATSVPRGQGEHILFVDDEAALARLGQTMLERLGYKVTMKTSALEAIAAVRDRAQPFDLVVTDLMMPVMDGVKLGSELRLMQPHLPMVIVTGSSGMMNLTRARELGFGGLLTKPSTARALGEVVHRVLHQTTSTGK
jgi:CheY-like chemotaxis protein